MSNAKPEKHALFACPECDLLQRLPSDRGPVSLRCRRCGCILHQLGRDLVEVPLALGVTALILFVLSNSFPLLHFGLHGHQDATYLLAGIRQLFSQDMPVLAGMVLFTTVLAPALHIGLLIYLFLPLSLHRRPPGFVSAIRLVQAVLPWSMLEIFLLGVLVAAVKLAERATIEPGPAAWSLGLLVLVLAAASTRVYPRQLWERYA